MKVLNFGSLNVDYVYHVDHIMQPGETQSSTQRQVFAGGKGLNQSVALAKAGLSTYHAGQVGDDADGAMLLEVLEKNGVSGTGNTRSALFMEAAVLILYVLFVYVAGMRLRLPVAVCFLTEAIYYSGLLVASVIYLKKASWQNKRI